MIFEILCPEYQHVVDLSYLDKPLLKFLTFTTQYSESGSCDSSNSLAAHAPDVCLEFARYFQLDTAEYHVIAKDQVEDRMDTIRYLVLIQQVLTRF